jgi:hypothetical protein
MFKRINDLLALLVLVVIVPLFWILDGLKILSMNGEVMGASIAGWTLILQYYFRKKSTTTEDIKPPEIPPVTK